MNRAKKEKKELPHASRTKLIAARVRPEQKRFGAAETFRKTGAIVWPRASGCALRSERGRCHASSSAAARLICVTSEDELAMLLPQVARVCVCVCACVP